MNSISFSKINPAQKIFIIYLMMLVISLLSYLIDNSFLYLLPLILFVLEHGFKNIAYKYKSYILICALLGTYLFFGYNKYDDLNGYLFFADYFSDTNELYQGWFNERRFQSLNFLSILQAFFFKAGIPNGVVFIEPILPLLLLGLYLFEKISDKRIFLLVYPITITLSLFVTINSSGYNHVLLLSTIILLEDKISLYSLFYALIIILMIRVSAFYVSLFLIIPLFLYKKIIFKVYKIDIIQLAISSIVLIVLLFPYYDSTKTLLFPILGDGFHATRYAYYQDSLSIINVAKSLLFYGGMFSPLLLKKDTKYYFYTVILLIFIVKINLSTYEIGPYLASAVIASMIYSFIKLDVKVVMLMCMVYVATHFQLPNIEYSKYELNEDNIEINEGLIITENALKYRHSKRTHVIDNYIGASPIINPLSYDANHLEDELKKLGICSVSIDEQSWKWEENTSIEYIERIKKNVTPWIYINIKEKKELISRCKQMKTLLQRI